MHRNIHLLSADSSRKISSFVATYLYKFTLVQDSFFCDGGPGVISWYGFSLKRASTASLISCIVVLFVLRFLL